MVAGLHIVRKLRPGKPAIWYVYAWRGGPLIHRTEGARPKITAELSDKAADERRQRGMQSGGRGTVKELIIAFRASPEWQKMAVSTKDNWGRWLDRFDTEFGEAELAVFDDRRMRGPLLEWRDRWAHQPRSADMAIQAVSRLLSWGFDRGRLSLNIASDITHLYAHDRSDVVWTPEDWLAFRAKASVELQEAADLASYTGLRRGDLVKLPWAAVGEHAIIWQTGKSRGKARIVVPLLPEAKALIGRIKARHESEMAARPENRRKPLPETVLSNSLWRPWTASGLGGVFNGVKRASGIAVNWHDLRGTFATRAMIAGLTDQEIADILGWTTSDVAAIRTKYVDQARVVVAIGERIAKARV